MKTLFRLFLILGFLCVFLTGFPFPKKLWIYWDEPIEKAPLLIRLCYEKFKFVCEKENWELNMLSEDMLPNYIDDYNTFLEIIKNAKTPFRQNRGDLVRFSLLDDHGGVYIDISTILIYGLKWLEEM
jgi:mannosyltransferase OCH1-like enzyme